MAYSTGIIASRRKVASAFAAVLVARAVCAAGVVTYEEFGAVGDGKTHLPWGHRPEKLPYTGVWQHDLFRGDFTPYDPSEIAMIKEAIGGK